MSQVQRLDAGREEGAPEEYKFTIAVAMHTDTLVHGRCRIASWFSAPHTTHRTRTHRTPHPDRARTMPASTSLLLCLAVILTHLHAVHARSVTNPSAIAIAIASTSTSSSDISSSSSTSSSSASAVVSVLPAAEPLLLLDADTNTNGTQLRQKVSIETNSIQQQPQQQQQQRQHGGGEGGGSDHNRSLKRVFLSNRTITCNDGSQAGFYLRKNPNSKKWIVFLEGGWHCYDTRSCRARWLRLRHLMTSAQWPETRDVGGILSPSPDENPYWHNANHVLVPYCSSDSWSGTSARGADARDNNWRFMGALILRQVIADLVPLGLGRATGAELLLVGSSAGGLGVMLNLDRITDYLLHERRLMVTVRGVSDSGWFLDREPYTPATIASSEAVRQGWKLWQGLLPEACAKQHAAEPWRCYFGYRLYPMLKSPLFVFQWLFDEAQMRADNVGAPVTPQQWNYIHEMGGALRSSLDNVTSVFAPSCIGHAVLSKRDWINIKIDDISLPSALRCWEHSTRPRRKRHDKLKRSTEATIAIRGHHNANANGNGGGKGKGKGNGKRKETNERHRARRPHRHEGRHQHGQLQQQQQQQHRRHHHRPPHQNSVIEPAKRHRQRPALTQEERMQRKRLRHDNERRNRRRPHRDQRKQRLREQLPSPNAQPPLEEGNTRSHSRPRTVGHKRRRKAQRERERERARAQAQAQVQVQAQTQAQAQAREEGRELQLQYELQQEQPVALEMQQKRSNANTNSNSNSNSNSKSSSHHGNGKAAQREHRRRVPRVPEKCALRLLERCSWPQCNHSCPTLTNPLTGEEMRFLELLTSFGLDIEAVAAALGVDMHTLNNMDRTELVNLLTQQVS